MPTYLITEDESFSPTTVSRAMFGANFVSHYDHELTEGNLTELLGDVGISTFRYPGGGITEGSFTESAFLTGNWDAEVSYELNGTIRNLTPMSSFFEAAGNTSANVQLVIPTRVAFTQSAGQALAIGEYGERTELDPAYFDLVKSFVVQATAEAELNGVEISRLELGNEFWGSGNMTANEYGYLAAHLTVFLDEEFPNLDVIIQITSSAGVYSPLATRDVFLEPDGYGDFVVHFDPEINEILPSGWLVRSMNSQGNGGNQTRDIANQFLLVPGATDNLDGIVDHTYFNGGFSGIDGERDYSLQRIREIFETEVGLDHFDYFVTEWSPRNPLGSDGSMNLGNINGLHYAHTVVEAFFEMSAAGVNGANFWPTTFGNPNIDSRTLIDTTDEDLTFGGTIFQWMSESVVGLQPVFDFELPGEIDVHGFASQAQTVIFVGERSGTSQFNETGEEIHLNLSEFGMNGQYLIDYSYLNSDSEDITDIQGNPVVSHLGAIVSEGDLLAFNLSSWDLVRIQLQSITEGDDSIFGTAANDNILVLGGDDRVLAGDGNDSLFGGDGDDTLRGDAGNDLLDGGIGNDSVYGGFGDDTIFSEFGNDEIFGGRGQDTLVFSEQISEFTIEAATDEIVFSSSNRTVTTHGIEYFELNGDLYPESAFSSLDTLGGGAGIVILVAGTSDNVLHGGLGDDIIWTNEGSDTIFGSAGDDDMGGGGDPDLLWGGAGHDTLYGGDGNDTLQGEGGDDNLWAGLDDDQIFGGTGNDNLGGSLGDDTIWGGEGSDLIFGDIGDDTINGDAGIDTLWAGTGNDRVSGGDDNDQLGGGPGRDTVFGDSGDDYISGHTENDILDGGAGNDTIWGWTGHDQLRGGDGDDLLGGGLDIDRMTGGSGADTFVFYAGHGDDVITDFTLSEDLIHIYGPGLTFDSLGRTSDPNGDALLDYGTGTLLLEGLDIESLVSSDFLFN